MEDVVDPPAVRGRGLEEAAAELARQVGALLWGDGALAAGLKIHLGWADGGRGGRLGQKVRIFYFFCSCTDKKTPEISNAFGQISTNIWFET